MPTQTQTARLLALVAIVLLSVFTAGAQSGRKVRKTTTPPVPMPTPEVPIAKPKEDPNPPLTLLVAIYQSNRFSTRGTVGGSVLEALEDRLNDHPGVRVVRLGGDITRGDAIRRAKSEKEAYVVWLELSLESLAGSPNGELRLSYWVFSPATAKVKSSGQTYPRMHRGRGVIRIPSPDMIYGDREVREAARDHAESILKAFHLQLIHR